jgi:hypothetical protein
MKKFVVVILLIAFSASFLTSCKKKKDEGDPPVLPPIEAMAIDFSNFELTTKTDFLILDQKGVEDSNWRFVATVAMLWKGIIVSTLTVPATAFQIAVNKTPVYIGDKTWEWNYDANVTIDQVSMTYKARLTGQIRTTDVLWKMYIAKEGTGGFAEFLWFEGTSKLDGTEGQWILNHSPQYQEPVLQIDWTNGGTSTGMVKYTYIRTLNNDRETDPFKNSYIEYGLTTNELNAYYTIHYYNGQQFSNIDVEWSTTGKYGRVRCEDFFPDSEWYCWDENYINIICP